MTLLQSSRRTPIPEALAPETAPSPSLGRVVAIDVARFVALIGMVVAHVSRQYTGDGLSGERTWWFALVDGRAAALFAVLAGVSLAFMTGGHQPAKGAELRRRQVGLLARALLLFGLGLGLGYVQTPVAVILCMYAVLFAAAVPLLRLRSRTLFALGAVWAVVGSTLLFALRNTSWRGGSSDLVNPTFDTLAHPGELLQFLGFTGMYPAIVWFAYVLIGAGIGRLDLRSTKVGVWLSGVGAAMTTGALMLHHLITPRPMTPEELMEASATLGISGGEPVTQVNAQLSELTARAEGRLTGWDGLFQAGSHTGTLGDLVHTMGTSLLIIGVLSLVVRRGTRLWSIACGAGAMTLTLYCLHVGLTDFRLPCAEALNEHPLRWHVAIVTLIGMGFALAGRSGPLEQSVTVAARTVSRRRA